MDDEVDEVKFGLRIIYDYCRYQKPQWQVLSLVWGVCFGLTGSEERLKGAKIALASDDERTKWIQRHLKTTYKPLIGDWGSWNPGDPLPVDSAPDKWITDIAWPLYKDEFNMQEAPNLATERDRFTAKYRTFKEKERSKAGKRVLDAIVKGTVSVASTTATATLPTPPAPTAPAVSNRRLQGPIRWAANLTGREMYLAEQRERINKAVNDKRTKDNLPKEQHPGLLSTAKKEAWSALSDAERASWNAKAKALADQPLDVFNNQQLMLHTLPDLVVTLPGMEKHQVGRSAFLLLGSFRDADDRLQTFHVQESYPSGHDFNVETLTDDWTAHCNEILLVSARTEGTKTGNNENLILFSSEALGSSPESIQWNLERFFKAHWARQRADPFDMSAIIACPSDFLDHDLDPKYTELLKDLGTQKLSARFFKPPRASPSPEAEPAPAPIIIPSSHASTLEKATPKKKKQSRNEAIAHSRPDYSSPLSSDHDWQESPNALHTPSGPSTKTKTKTKKAVHDKGLGISVMALLSAQKPDELGVSQKTGGKAPANPLLDDSDGEVAMENPGRGSYSGSEARDAEAGEVLNHQWHADLHSLPAKAGKRHKQGSQLKGKAKADPPEPVPEPAPEPAPEPVPVPEPKKKTKAAKRKRKSDDDVIVGPGVNDGAGNDGPEPKRKKWWDNRLAPAKGTLERTPEKVHGRTRAQARKNAQT
ncbi:hypothetical protein PQX77_019403 [Marasmius sp. AFHP31]|nr:hypothetical protein PQX77_019403 [Marasmius sp. AFHP31]